MLTLVVGSLVAVLVAVDVVVVLVVVVSTGGGQNGCMVVVVAVVMVGMGKGMAWVLVEGRGAEGGKICRAVVGLGVLTSKNGGRD